MLQVKQVTFQKSRYSLDVVSKRATKHHYCLEYKVKKNIIQKIELDSSTRRDIHISYISIGSTAGQLINKNRPVLVIVNVWLSSHDSY